MCSSSVVYVLYRQLENKEGMQQAGTESPSTTNTVSIGAVIDLSTARPPVLVFMIYASLAWILNMKAISLHYNITDQLSD